MSGNGSESDGASSMDYAGYFILRHEEGGFERAVREIDADEFELRMGPFPGGGDYREFAVAVTDPQAAGEYRDEIAADRAAAAANDASELTDAFSGPLLHESSGDDDGAGGAGPYVRAPVFRASGDEEPGSPPKRARVSGRSDDDDDGAGGAGPYVRMPEPCVGDNEEAEAQAKRARVFEHPSDDGDSVQSVDATFRADQYYGDEADEDEDETENALDRMHVVVSPVPHARTPPTPRALALTPAPAPAPRDYAFTDFGGRSYTWSEASEESECEREREDEDSVFDEFPDDPPRGTDVETEDDRGFGPGDRKGKRPARGQK